MMYFVCFSGLALRDPEAQTKNCLMFIGTRWMWSSTRHVFQSVIVFCRFHSHNATSHMQQFFVLLSTAIYDLLHLLNCLEVLKYNTCAFSKYCELFRFMYVRYASGLVREGERLLHQVILVYLSCQIIIWYARFFYDFLYLSNYMDSIKFKFCEMQNIVPNSEEDFKAFSLKPKLILIVLSLIYFSCFTYAYFGAFNSR